MSTRPACRSRPSSQITTSPKVRWMSMPITRRIRASSPFDMTGAAGDTTTTDSRSRRNRASRRGGQLLTRARSSSYASACPHLRAPGASVPDGRTIRRDPKTAAGHRHRESHTGYQPHRKHLRYRAPPHDPIEGLPVQQDGARDGLQTARGRAEKLASSRWPQPVAKTRPR